jgi:hypothetical protein
MFKDLREFVKIYMNDIMIFFKNFENHFNHLRQIFKRLQNYNVTLNSKKVFFEYSSIMLLKQIINALDLTIAEKKLVAIVNLTFLLTLKKLKIYLNFIDYLRVYVSWYAQIFLSLQERKILLFKNDLVKSKSRRTFAKRISLNQLIEAKQRFYEHLQHVFSDKKFLHHVNNARKLFVDVNIFKKKNIEAMIFHVKKDFEKKIIFNRFDIQSIMFLSKILTNAESRYWSIELKMIDVVWVIKKIRHLIEASRNQLTIIFTNHSTLTEIIKQTFLNTFNIDKLNLRLVKAFQYLSILSINIKVKSEKFHIISNVLFRLFSIMNIHQSSIDEKSVFEDL